MKIALISVGTRGDIQPYLAVAHALRDRGHECVLAIHDEFAPLVRAHGFEHRTMRANFRDMMQTDLGRAWLSSADNPIAYGRYARELFLPLQEGWLEDADAAVEGCDGVAFYTLAMGGLYAAQRRKLPAVALAPWPMEPTREGAPMVAVWLRGLPGFLKRVLTHLLFRMAFSDLNPPHAAYRERTGLPPSRTRDPVHYVLESGVPLIHLFSDAVIARPSDWNERCHVAGFAFLPEVSYQPPQSLLEFLSSGPAPIYLGFGSMTGFEPEQLAELATRAARAAGVRAIVCSGWAGLAPKANDDVYVIDEIPHDWLFPCVSAVVHHGGVGTFAEGLRAGKPTVIAAFFGDQPFWGWVNERLGTGPRALRRKNITAENLAAAIREALSNPSYRARAEEIGRGIRAENGAMRAAQLIEQAFVAGGLQGRIRP